MLSRLLPTVSQPGSLPQCSFHPWATCYHCSICGVRQSFTEKLALDYCVGKLFSKMEQVTLCTSNIVPGIGFSDNLLSQGGL